MRHFYFIQPIMTTTTHNSVPENTYIYVSKFRVYLRIFLGILFLASAIYIYVNSVTNPNAGLGRAKIIMYAGPVVALYLFYQAFEALKKKGPQITLSDKGIIIAEKPLMLWDDISEIKLIWGNSKMLNFKHRNEKIKVNFETLNIKPFELEKLLNTYKTRHLQNAQHNVISE